MRPDRRSLPFFALLLRASLAVAISTSLVGCFAIDLEDLVKLTKKKNKKKKGSSDSDDDEDADATDLGLARFPEGTKKPLAEHDWHADHLEPGRYKLEYAMSRDKQDEVLAAHKAFATKVGYEAMGEGKFRWYVPPGCEADMGCAFGAMSDSSREALEPIVERFKKRRDEEKLDAEQASELVVTFVQNIHYEEPKDQPFGILPPASVVAEKRGDCDSKSLLAHLILRELGVDSVMLSSRAHRHAMLGIALPAPGKTFRFGGRQYAFTELTAKGSPIGHINPELLEPDDWKVVPTRWPSSSWSGATK
jgi:hypothetical protein